LLSPASSAACHLVPAVNIPEGFSCQLFSSLDSLGIPQWDLDKARSLEKEDMRCIPVPCRLL
jgi:hypothetical protein